MPDAPTDIGGRARILLVEDDLSSVRRLLSHLTEAGLDCRYAPAGQAGLQAVEETAPHLVLLGATDVVAAMAWRGEALKHRTMPILFLIAEEDEGQIKNFGRRPGEYLLRNAAPNAVLDRVSQILHAAYGGSALFSEASGHTADEVPAGWGSCRACGYLGPRQKFVNPDRLSPHPLLCPACHRSDEITVALG